MTLADVPVPSLEMTLQHGIEILSCADVNPALQLRWKQLLRHQRQPVSPYYYWDFVRAVAQVRDDVEVAVIRRGEQVMGFLPYQRTGPRTAEPVGGRINDVHGIIGLPTTAQILDQVLSAAGLSSFSFHALEASPAQVPEYCFEAIGTYSIDLADGWPAYNDWIRQHSSTVHRHAQKRRALERDLGSIRLEFDRVDEQAIQRLIDLKREKYRRTKTFDLFSVNWTADLLRELSQIRTSEFQGLLSCLWAGDRIVASHFGLLADQTLHYWFPTYETPFKKYSPGTELILRIAEEAASRGISKIDFGYGDDEYKFRFCNVHQKVLCGLANPNKLSRKWAARKYQLRNQLKRIPYKPLAKAILRQLYPGFGNWNYR